MVLFTWWAVAPVIGGVAAAADSRNKIDKLKLYIIHYNESIREAEADLKNVDLTRLRETAKQIRNLIQS